MTGTSPASAYGQSLDAFFAGPVIAGTYAATREGVYPFGITAGTLELAGIARADLDEARDGGVLPDVEQDRSMYLKLGDYGIRHPGISLRSAIGWYLAFRADPNIPTEDPVDVWVRADRAFVETGWLFLAAGIGLDEALTHLNGGVDVDALAAMAVLRGTHLPAYY